jgi:hypothetical protein
MDDRTGKKLCTSCLQQTIDFEDCSICNKEFGKCCLTRCDNCLFSYCLSCIPSQCTNCNIDDSDKMNISHSDTDDSNSEDGYDIWKCPGCLGSGNCGLEDCTICYQEYCKDCLERCQICADSYCPKCYDFQECEGCSDKNACTKIGCADHVRCATCSCAICSACNVECEDCSAFKCEECTCFHIAILEKGEKAIFNILKRDHMNGSSFIDCKVFLS